jgi:hypothetical protein
VIDPHIPAATLRRCACARGVDEDASHDLSGQREKVHAIVPVDIVDVDETQIGLVDEGRAL